MTDKELADLKKKYLDTQYPNDVTEDVLLLIQEVILLKKLLAQSMNSF